ncbi:MAG: thiamine pyrophosphate-dependent enzyme, partial [Acidimicrobiia bacterium]|nr:thiamine pyrophosphate-dependent enzyme [Acidimicrobiia bacterium]
GGFQLGAGELATVAQHNLPIVICVFNDGGYGVLREIQDAVVGERFGVDLQPVRFDLIGQGMGLRSARVSGVAEFERAFTDAVAHDGPTLLDIDLSALSPMRFPLPPHQRRKA